MDEEWEQQFDKVFREFISRKLSTWTKEPLRQYAAEAHPILVSLAEEGTPLDADPIARNRPTITYKKLGDQIDLTNDPTKDLTYISNITVTIDKIGAKKGDPPVSPLVVNKKTEGPGNGYFKWNHLNEETINNPRAQKKLTEKQREVWRSKLREVYAHEDWYWP